MFTSAPLCTIYRTRVAAAWRLCAGSFEEIYANERNLTLGNILMIFETRGVMVINAGNATFFERKKAFKPMRRP